MGEGQGEAMIGLGGLGPLFPLTLALSLQGRGNVCIDSGDESSLL